MTTKSKKRRSAAASVLGEKGSVSPLVVDAQEPLAVVPDKEIKGKKLRVSAKKVASMRKSIGVKTSEARKSPAGQGVFFSVGSFCGKIKRLGCQGWEKV